MPLLVSTRLPLVVPDVPGVNTTGTFTLCAAFSVRGVVMPRLNPVPETVPWVMVTAEPPVFVIFTVCVAGVLRTCDPKPRLLGVAVSVPDEADVVGVGVGFAELLLAVLLLPPQPIMVKAAATSKRKRPVCNVEFILLRTVYSSFGGLSAADSRAALILFLHFITSTFKPQEISACVCIVRPCTSEVMVHCPNSQEVQ